MILIILGLFLGAGSVYAQEQAAPVDKNAILRPRVEFPGELVKDPFMSVLPGVHKENPEVAEVKEEDIVLPIDIDIQGLIWGGKNPLVIINNKVYKVNDSIDEVKIVDIRKEGAEVIYKGKTFILPAPSKPKSE